MIGYNDICRRFSSNSRVFFTAAPWGAWVRACGWGIRSRWFAAPRGVCLRFLQGHGESVDGGTFKLFFRVVGSLWLRVHSRWGTAPWGVCGWGVHSRWVAGPWGASEYSKVDVTFWMIRLLYRELTLCRWTVRHYLPLPSIEAWRHGFLFCVCRVN